MRVAALTMVYNEPVWARVWVRHYSRQVGAENCLVLDHGSTDGSTSGLGVAVERVRRSALDEDWRAGLISDCAATLLRRFDAVVHSDADELLVADPGQYPDLQTYAGVAPQVTTAVGLDLQHLPGEEAGLEVERPIGEQRQWVRFSGAMCKPALIRKPVRWGAGFHGCDQAREVGPLYLVHLRYADLGAGLARLARTRGQSFSRDDVNLHQRVDDADFEAMVRQIGRLPRVDGEPGLEPGGALALDGRLVAPWMMKMAAGWDAGDPQLGLAGSALWRLPEAFRRTL